MLTSNQSQRVRKQKHHTDRNPTIGEVEHGERADLHKICDKAIGQPIEQVAEGASDDEPEGNAFELAATALHGKPQHNEKCDEDEERLHARELNPECHTVIQCIVQRRERSDERNRCILKKGIGEPLGNHAEQERAESDGPEHHFESIKKQLIFRKTKLSEEAQETNDEDRSGHPRIPCLPAGRFGFIGFLGFLIKSFSLRKVNRRMTAVFRRIDLLLLGIAMGLTLFGLAMIASVSVFESYQLTTRLVSQGVREAPSNSFYLWRSAIHVFTGFVAMCFTMIIPYRLWERYARTLFLLTIVSLIGVFIPGLSNDYGTAHSWLHLGPFSFQPSEFLKITLVFYMAVWLQKREQLIGTFKEGFIPFVTLLVLSTFLVAAQPDLGGFLVLSSIAITMFFIAGGNIFHLLMGGTLAGTLGLPVILSKEYVRNRFRAWMNPSDPTIAEGIGFQIKQALIAIGSGGPFGVGYGKSIQKFGYLPEVQADMIFAAMGEELGFFRMMIILTMYSIFVIRGYKIAREAPDRFGFMVATGITTWIASQTLVNIAVNLSIFPLTGLTLPFISYGGSSLVTTLAGVGILLNISMHSVEQKITERRPREHKWQSVLFGR